MVELVITLAAAFIAVVIVLIIDIPLSLYRGFVFSKLWHWFFVPFGLPEIGTLWGWGIALTIHFLTYQFSAVKESDKEKSTGEKALTGIITSLIMSSIVWVVGAYIHYLMGN